ncbi:flagellar export chaperone FlgN [Lentisphaerota bacterium WC36G]|nr:flagellar protein FlgN [Lentisphaerae bacterium WC36]
MESLPHNFQELSMNIKNTVDELIESSDKLQDAIIDRDVEIINSILEFQRKKLIEFNNFNSTWEQLVIAPNLNSPQLKSAKQQICNKILMLKQFSNRNAALVRSFLSIIHKAIQNVGIKHNSTSNVYGKRGRINRQASSLIINQLG